VWSFRAAGGRTLPSGVAMISAEELLPLRDLPTVVIVDLRNEDEDRDAAHIHGSWHSPAQHFHAETLLDDLQEFTPSAKTVVFYHGASMHELKDCVERVHAELARREKTDLQVMILRGGITVWSSKDEQLGGLNFPTCCCKCAACSKMEGEAAAQFADSLEASGVERPPPAPQMAAEQAVSPGGGGVAAGRRGKERAPAILVADSAPLFSPWWKQTVGPLVQAALKAGDGSRKVASYLGANNYDNPDYFDMFKMAAAEVGFAENSCHFVTADNGAQRLELVAQHSALIVIGGGDTAAGWESMQKTSLAGALRRAGEEGAILVGVSSGATQLGTHGYEMRSVASPFFSSADSNMPMSSPLPQKVNPSFATLGLIPFVFGTSDEANDWQDCRLALKGLPGSIGIGISSGTALVVFPDQTVCAYQIGQEPPVVLDGAETGKMPIRERCGLRHDDRGRVLVCTWEDGNVLGRESARRVDGKSWNS
jgi:cyanophycinase